ncbi:MAG TPA: hypothetical protein VK817_06405 [Trebonia sp.]|nr:hypothetical protein [Trebonia sp.]
MRYRTLLSGAALAVLTLTAAGCASDAPGSSGSSGLSGGTGAAANAADVTGGSGGTAVTAAQARQVFGSYVSGTATALSGGDKDAALALTTGVASDTVSGQFAAAARTRAKLPSYKYGTPVFYRPALSTYPQWFVASVPRTASAAPATGTTDGVRLSAHGQVLLVFARESAGRPWLLASSAQLTPGQSLPALATAANGDAVSAPLDDSATLGEPQVVGPLQAAVVDDGPASAASRAVAAGPLTTGIYATQNHPSPRYAAPHDDIRQWALEGSNYGTYALRTADGGALVFYAMYLNTVIETHTVEEEASPLVAGPPIAIPPDFAPLLPANTPAPKYSLETQYAMAFAAVDPPSATAGAKISVVALGGGPNWANT